MSERATSVTLGPKFFLPFLLGDLFLLAAAGVIWQQASRPMTPYEVGAFAACVALGAWLGVWPFRLRQEAELKLAETAELTNTLAQIGRLEDAAHRIDMATGQWQTVQEHAGRTMTAAREIADRMAAEQRDFRTFMEKADETERAHLRLEVNKLRRAEGDWLQVLVRILDHVYALYMAGVRSGQPHLAEQFAQFQNACRDAARRVGMVPIVATPGAAFDAEVHQLPEQGAAAPDGATVLETLATGYAFQGQLLRRAVVAIRPPSAPLPATAGMESFGSHAAVSAPAGTLTTETVPPTEPTAADTASPEPTVGETLSTAPETAPEAAPSLAADLAVPVESAPLPTDSVPAQPAADAPPSAEVPDDAGRDEKPGAEAQPQLPL